MLLRKFSWLYRCADWRCKEFFAAENIKDIKSFRAKNFGFNISGNYSGHFSLKTQCTACCSQRVAQRKENTLYIIVHQLTLVLARKTKTGKTPCAWCKMALTSHWYCDWLRIPRASSGIFSQSQHHPIGFCIKHKAINRKKNVLLERSRNIL